MEAALPSNFISTHQVVKCFHILSLMKALDAIFFHHKYTQGIRFFVGTYFGEMVSKCQVKEKITSYDKRCLREMIRSLKLLVQKLESGTTRSAKEIWDTLCVQYDGTAVLMESRKIFLVRQYESFIHQKDETLSQLHQRFNCLLIDLKTIGTTYSNSEVVTKFMEALPEHWEIYISSLTMSKDIKTLTLSELYGILLNREQQKKLKKNLIRDSKDTKSNSVALVSDSVPTVATPSSVTITELESSDSDMSEDPEFNESLALLTRSFKKFAKKGNFHKKKHLTITDKPKSDPVDKATAICYNCQGKGHFANDCRYRKSQFAPSSAKSSSKNPKYQRLKEKYKKMKAIS
ncbi:hypothetical protein OSB04_023768 [Centaurea solstitialis]|uniref:CCHC-type domain-containing protein n=1 Tax=Centaurea solstitialis TaxID=347529 RepID=A0AA38SWL7_9ASTR|nr:hypothetical protein OSB04_023768 [Centaurea solstitialis]